MLGDFTFGIFQRDRGKERRRCLVVKAGLLDDGRGGELAMATRPFRREGLEEELVEEEMTKLNHRRKQGRRWYRLLSILSEFESASVENRRRSSAFGPRLPYSPF
ncbi:hypothetical protein CDL15_Pgr016078 [Punica granatum]|uniref:Uncharacterized protein n=1 Tax=Punica granatum TaxID=22663 RepID=A0A218X056_PUNGR|nr:hypothetical protein CDL15_Pgr016078 [Punica granatum]